MLATSRQNNIVVAQSQNFSQDQIQLIKNTIAKGCTDDEFGMFLAVCNRTGLDPFAKQLYAVPRWDSKANRNVISFQVSIDGFRLIAVRTGKYRGQVGAFWCGKDGQWRDCWLEDEPPAAAKVGVLHADFKEPLYRVAKFKSFVQTTKDGKPNQFWSKMPELMIAKVAESQALRAAFPQELSGLYTPDEMGNPEIQDEIFQNNNYAPSTVQTQVDPDRKILADKVLVLMRDNGITKEDAQNMMRTRYSGKQTRDSLTTDELRDFVNHLESYSQTHPMHTPIDVQSDIISDDEDIPFN